MIDKRKFYINGQWVSPSKPNDYEVINPSTEEAFATISLGSTEDTNAAVSAAKKALVSWSESSKDERLNLLEKLLSIYIKRYGEMADAISMEMGAPMDWATDVQTSSGQSHLEDFIIIFLSLICGFSTACLILKIGPHGIFKYSITFIHSSVFLC